MDWRALLGTSNFLSIIGTLVSALGVLVSVLYARGAKQTAVTALEAAASARRELLLRIAAQECREMMAQAASVGRAIRENQISVAEQISAQLNVALAGAKGSWPEIAQETRGEIGLVLRENQRILRLLRSDSVHAEERVAQGSEMVDLINQWLGQIYGRLRFRS